ncbi:globin domain-containing protein [Salinicoccus halitifaciens]|uniref:nitric oxide dioxygenase n=1 Tax=Salinicoccus halitifaciens TaxID=1073415 RepID=A0ABV2E7P5_9STAP|nr:globin domain-containing protein [Salinicoccus halitifaciens]MCD2136496.1 FAD-binding oxidoreductase [Salinicoccus halitifaciens]
MELHKKEIIKATVPALEEHGTTITTVFYQNMFKKHPDLLNMFNQTNQKVGDQPKALAFTVLQAARHIDDLEAIVPAVIGIAHKHRALNVKPEHYPIVGENLLEGIKEVLGDAATPEIMDAWEEYYGEIAQIFIDVEAGMYKEAEWDGFVPFKVTGKDQLSDDIVRYTVKSDEVDFDVRAGQYITVKVDPSDYPYEALRHYSICSIHTEEGLQFAVKKEGTDDTAGVVSHHMHDDVQVGDTLELSAPAGDFLLDPADEKLLFIAGGVGATPVMAMIEEAIEAGKDPKFIYSVQNKGMHPFKDEMQEFGERIDVKVKYSDDEGFLNHEDFEGLQDRSVYICGSMHFMNAMIKVLHEVGFSEDNIHFEPFGPKMSLVGETV